MLPTQRTREGGSAMSSVGLPRSPFIVNNKELKIQTTGRKDPSVKLGLAVFRAFGGWSAGCCSGEGDSGGCFGGTI